MQQQSRILLVDDSRTNLAILQEILGDHYTLQTAKCGEDALALAPDFQPDLVLLDIMMPGIGGYETCRRLRLHPTLRHTRIILVSARAMISERLEGYEAGADDYITKPFDDEELLAKIRVYLRLQAVEQVQQFTSNVLEAIPSILIGLDLSTTITWWNTTAEQVLGLPSPTACGQTLATCPIPWDSATVLEGLGLCQRSGQTVRLDDVRFQATDTSQGFLSLTIAPIPDQQTDGLHFLLMGADVTMQKMLEAHLVRAQKLEAIGRLAAGVAHEINTPTQYIGDNVRFLQDAFHDLMPLLEQYSVLLQANQAGQIPTALLHAIETTAEAVDVEYLRAEIPQALQQSLEGIERVATIVRAMKDFSHPGTTEKIAIDLNQAIESTITVARNEWKYVADIVTDFDPHLPPVPCMPGELNQVMLNLIVNAAHAIADVLQSSGQEKGTIRLSTRCTEAWVEIRVADTGGGIPEAVQDKIFDPFFTTKDVGKGTGQGLAMAHDVIVHKHGGTLTFETVAGQGTTFSIRLPLDLAEERPGDETTRLDTAA
ncbi:MAG: response regulator [Candidatus Tectimicrobiota bacterium]